MIAGAGATLLAIDLATYVWLRRHCDRADHTCSSGSADPTSADHRDQTSLARTMRGLNIAAFVGLIGVAAVAAIDGVVVYRRDGELTSLRLWLAPTAGGLSVDLTF